MKAKVIYLTGAPASGKSTTVKKLLESRSDIELWEYSQRLIDYVNVTRPDPVTHSLLRQTSGALVRPEDIAEVDKLLINFVVRNKGEKHVIIDSHPLTREEYGFRCTAFSLPQIQAIAPDEVWVLYADPKTTIARIETSGGGRKAVDEEHARMHTYLQASIATSYGIAVGKPVYFFDSTVDQDDLVERLAKRLL
ncbi:ATP-binding protein [Bradyrhizobium centrosematis]|uniref:ATP-binding protein n=1 Tax=Bradyrhizobium centrosematis TaxID=1300039 RepID=UPI002169D9F0|nr:ATP-binding protein [Bradyrhizobium centrosematis]MCS3761595.1 adenylate kinase [Bradyrhizobium centrosematis]MCS3774263.1 adenylate kinase [Bradyrhizobium centrosematis]